MGLFKKSYVERIKNIYKMLHEVSLNEDDLILKFNSEVKEIEEYDIEFIRLIKKLAKEGHLSEKLKIILLNQLIGILRRLEELKFEEHDRLKEIRDEIESFLEIELTAEMIGIEVNEPIYHGSAFAGVKSFEIEHEDIDQSNPTLGRGIYCTDNRRMGINYAFERYRFYSNAPYLVNKYDKNLRPTLYTIRFKSDKSFIADFTDPRKTATIYKSLEEFCVSEMQKHGLLTPKNESVILSLVYFRQHLRELLESKQLLRNIRHMLDQDYRRVGILVEFLKGIGYSGLRSIESGEYAKRASQLPYEWVSSFSYVVFNPSDIEIIAEEHFALEDGNVISVE